MKQKFPMNQKEDQDWARAERKFDREIQTWAVGALLASVVIALVMILSEQLEQPLAMRALTAVLVCMSVSSFFLWRRSEKGSLSRGFSSVLGFLSLFGGLIGVIQWG